MKALLCSILWRLYRSHPSSPLVDSNANCVPYTFSWGRFFFIHPTETRLTELIRCLEGYFLTGNRFLEI